MIKQKNSLKIHAGNVLLNIYNSRRFLIHQNMHQTLSNHRQSKEWTGKAGKIDNAADATSVMRPDTLEPCISTLNIFQDFVSTNFKQEQQCLCDY